MSSYNIINSENFKNFKYILEFNIFSSINNHWTHLKIRCAQNWVSKTMHGSDMHTNVSIWYRSSYLREPKQWKCSYISKTKGPLSLTVTCVSENVHWLLFKRAHFLVYRSLISHCIFSVSFRFLFLLFSRTPPIPMYTRKDYIGIETYMYCLRRNLALIWVLLVVSASEFVGLAIASVRFVFSCFLTRWFCI